MTDDRRTAPRFGKLTPATLVGDNRRDAATAVDVSATGAFLRTHLLLPVGSVVQVTLQAGHASGSVARMLARVVRIAEPGSRIYPVPGVGLEWLSASSAAGEDTLRGFLRDTLHIPAERLQSAKVRVGDAPNVAVLHLHPDFDRPDGETWAGELVVPSFGDHLPVSARRMHRPPEKREADRFWVRSEIVYTIDDLPHAGMVYNLSAKSAMVATQQRLPERGSEIQCRLPLTGPYSECWLRFTGKIMRHVSISGSKGEGFVVSFTRIDEMGQPGVFRAYLDHLHRAQSDDPHPRG